MEKKTNGRDSDFLRLIAFYLPQFHPTPENDQWWGKGFTEWTNVTKALPLFNGHLQPHLPSDFGFYDLRVQETRRDQIQTAKNYNIDGFCYHYYWFSGTRILNRPLDDMLADPDSDMPFCLCWANESWTRRWDAADHEVLIEQKYLPGDDLAFIKSLVPFFEDRRYIRVDGRPFLIIYRPQHLPDARRSSHVWRDHCRSVGLGEIHICAALTHGNMDYKRFGFDSGVEFPPHNLSADNINRDIRFYKAFRGNVIQYADVACSYLERDYEGSRIFRTVFPSWDNTARTNERALVVLNGVPDNYEYWLSSTIDRTLQSSLEGDKLVFINAWNEWAEGCHLEPDRWFGHSFLQATQNAKRGLRRFAYFPETRLPHVGESRCRKFWQDIGEVLNYHGALKFGEVKLTINRLPWLRQIILSAIRLVRTFNSRVIRRDR
ncbi:MAG: glycoside hydrolase family 99-like domain-containing protein [Desulfuromonadales bacterium]|nr:glycoside hydrolase family 99-like domain-containing protein [Desulfuromonadales bacterium]MDW7757185.1 glycoside hydrolase family 99-like domain-containing protein [Desulfuromonadales bacterium]